MILSEKKGASLVWGVLLCTILLILGATTSTTIIKESRTSTRMDDSSRAYAAAESGINWGRFYLDSGTSCETAAIKTSTAPFYFTIKEAEADISYQVIFLYDLASPAPCRIQSMGTANVTNRKIEYVFTEEALLERDPINLAGTYSVKRNFVTEFYLWAEGSPSNYFVGLNGPSGSKFFVRYQTFPGPASLVLTVVDRNGVTKPSATINLSTVPTDYTPIKIRIEYLSENSAKLSVKELEGTSEVCKKSVIIGGLDTNNISDLNKFYFNTVPTKISGSSIGDGDFYRIGSAGTSLDIDNLSTSGICLVDSTPTICD